MISSLCLGGCHPRTLEALDYDYFICFLVKFVPYFGSVNLAASSPGAFGEYVAQRSRRSQSMSGLSYGFESDQCCFGAIRSPGMIGSASVSFDDCRLSLGSLHH